MPCPHNEISIVQRSQRQSAVAAAAYQSGEKLFCEYDQEVKHYPEKRGIVHNEILLPANAPPEYADRNTFWNAAEAVEKQWNSQLARRWVLTIPREIPPYQYAALVREFCKQQFVSKGMIVDFAIHDPNPPGHNPHAHVMLTMRAMDGHGKWLPKSRKVYDLDENGERIKLPSGRWKSHKEDTVDWNDRKYCEIWRHEWEVIQNRYLEANNRPERVDLRSYARQGLDIVPTVHEGAAVRQMEKRGIQTNIGNLNREIKAANRLMQSIRQLIKNLKSWITELGEKRKELLAQKAAEEATLLPNLLMKYMEIRKEERKDWTRSGQNRGTSQDLKAVSEALSYLQQKGLSTVEDLEAFLESSGKSAADYEHIFLFSKSKKYFFDYKAISEPIAPATAERLKRGMKGGNKYGKPVPGQPQPQTINRPREHGEIKDADINPLRNKRDVWKINTVPFKGGHYAAYPPKLVETCLLAGCPEGGVVLDPFMGSGTTGMVASQMGRHFIGIELNPEYTELAYKRIGGEI